MNEKTSGNMGYFQVGHEAQLTHTLINSCERTSRIRKMQEGYNTQQRMVWVIVHKTRDHADVKQSMVGRQLHFLDFISAYGCCMSSFNPSASTSVRKRYLSPFLVEPRTPEALHSR